MRHLVAIAAAISILFAMQAARAQSESTAAGYWHCQSNMGNSNTVYFSAVFEGTANQPVDAAFAQMLAEKYGFTDAGSCGIAWKSSTTIDKLNADEKSYSAQLRAAGKKVVETGWFYDAATVHIRFWCNGMVNVSGQGPVKNYFYLSRVFEVSGSDIDALPRKWRSYLKSQRSEAGALISLANCTAAQADQSRTDAQIASWIAKYSDQAEIVRTDWKGD